MINVTSNKKPIKLSNKISNNQQFHFHEKILHKMSDKSSNNMTLQPNCPGHHHHHHHRFTPIFPH